MGRTARGSSLRRGSDTAAWHDAPPEFADLEERWQAYLQSEEFLTFHAVIESLLSLPPTSQLAERRADFELLIHLLDRLGHALSVKHVNKAYRAQYSPDVQLSGYLYSTLLTAFTLLPSYTLNGQEFYVSDTVLDQCHSLQFVFQETCKELKKQFENLQPYSLEHIRNDVKRSLVYFDRSWCRFEIPALEEIEAIHRQACRPLIEAIEVEQALTQYEGGGPLAQRGSCAPGAHRARLEVQRNKFLEKICELNRLANIDGKGRNDMDLACLLEAERIAAKPMCAHPHRDPAAKDDGVHGRCGSGNCAPPVLVRVARSLLRSLERLRRVLQRYARCLYQLNSHLANNPDLVRGLELFESAWEKANKYLVQPGSRRLALHTYNIVMSVNEPGFLSSLDNLDPEFLVASLPRALLFHEMRRAASSGSSGARAFLPAVKQAKAGDRTSPSNASTAAAGGLHAGTVGPCLPRPALDKPRSTAPPASALQRSPLARTFLPLDVAPVYNDAVATMERLSEARLARIRKLLISPPSCAGGSSSSSTPPPVRPRLPTGSSATSGRAGHTDQPPRTPCPPRMAVPNSSRPATGKGAGLTGLASRVGSGLVVPSSLLHEIAEPESEEDESDEEDEKLAITLATLKSGTGSITDSKPPTAQAPPADSCGGGGAKAREDPEERQVIASISTLALHLQRERPNDWNELIQVVLQGLLAVRGPACSSNPATVAHPPAEIL